MSFGESVFSAEFIQKTVKVDLYVRINHAYPQQDWHQKDLEDIRGHHAEVERRLAPPTGQPALRAHQSVPYCNVGSLSP